MVPKQSKTIKITCAVCGEVFDGIKSDKLCVACRMQIEDYRQQIKTYMEEFPKVSAAQLSMGANIPMFAIDYLIAEDFFYVTEAESVEFKPLRRCKKCAKAMDGNGRFCEDCLKEILASEVKNIDSVNQLKNAEEDKSKEKIRFHMAAKG